MKRQVDEWWAAEKVIQETREEAEEDAKEQSIQEGDHSYDSHTRFASQTTERILT